MDFRLYDGALGRFFGIDLLADLFTSHSPYHFAYNNPITFMDPTGLHIDPAEPTQQSGTTDWGTDWEFEEGDDGLPVLVIDVNRNRKYWRPSPGDSPGAYTMNVMVISHGYGGSRGGGGSGGGRNDNGNPRGASNGVDFAGFVNDGAGGFATGLTQNGQNGNRLYIGTARPGNPVNFLGNKYNGNGRVYIKASYMNTVGKTITRASVVGSVALGSYNIYQGVQQDGGTFGNNATVATLQAVGGFVGAMDGAIVGAKAGAIVGVWLGGVGAAPLIIVGGIVGGIIGGWAGI